MEITIEAEPPPPRESGVIAWEKFEQPITAAEERAPAQPEEKPAATPLPPLATEPPAPPQVEVAALEAESSRPPAGRPSQTPRGDTTLAGIGLPPPPPGMPLPPALQQPPAAGPYRTAQPPPVRPGEPYEPALYEAVTKLSHDVIERIVWEVVPDLAERIIREELDRLVEKRRSG